MRSRLHRAQTRPSPTMRLAQPMMVPQEDSTGYQPPRQARFANRFRRLPYFHHTIFVVRMGDDFSRHGYFWPCFDACCCAEALAATCHRAKLQQKSTRARPKLTPTTMLAPISPPPYVAYRARDDITRREPLRSLTIIATGSIHFRRLF